MQGLLSLPDLRLVHAIAGAGTLSGAASRLRVDHSTAFRRLSAIERRLGAHLFERRRDGYTPTHAGEVATAAAERILDAVGELEQRLAGEDMRPSGLVRITIPDTLLALIAPLLAALHAERPEITTELVVANVFLTLTRRDADIAIRPAASAPDNLMGRRLARLATAPYAAADYLARHDEASLPGHAWIGFDESLAHLASARWVEANVAKHRISHRANSLLALQAAARAGMGVAALPCYLGDADPALRRVHPPLAEMESSLWLLTQPELRRVARIRAVLDFLAERMGSLRALIEGSQPRD